MRNRTIEELGKESVEIAKSKGFLHGLPNVGETIALIHSEISEALEADREDRQAPTEWDDGNVQSVTSWGDDEVFKKKFEATIKDTYADELADASIRIFQEASLKGIDLEAHIIGKMRYNELRAHKHGNKKY